MVATCPYRTIRATTMWITALRSVALKSRRLSVVSQAEQLSECHIARIHGQLARLVLGGLQCCPQCQFEAVRTLPYMLGLVSQLEELTFEPHLLTVETLVEWAAW